MSSSVSNKSSSSSSSIASQAAARAAAAERARKAAEAAAKKAAAAAAKKAAGEASKRKDGFEGKHLTKLTKNFTSAKTADVHKLGNGKGVSTLNKDGSQTTKLEKEHKGTKTEQTLTTTRNKFTGETRLNFEETKTTGHRETKTKLTGARDILGRTTSTQSHETAIQKGDVTRKDSRSTAVDAYGNKKITTGAETAVKKGHITTSDATSTTRGAFNTKQTVVEHKTAVLSKGNLEAMEEGQGKKGQVLTTTTHKSTTGTDFALSSSKEFKDGTFTLKDSAAYKKNSFNKEVGKEKQYEIKDAKADTGFTQKNQSSKLDKAQTAGDLLGAAGLKKTLLEGKKFDTTGKPESFAKPNSEFVGSRVGVRGEGKLTVGANGVEGNFKREAVAGLYAEKSHEAVGKYGTAGYQAQAKIEAKASFDAKGKLNANGLDVSVGAKVGVSAEASIKGTLQSKPVKFAGVDLTAGVEGNARVSAEASAEATGKATITRNPPTAILEGKAGASAVVKAEADVKVSAGPFAVKASGYASAGAEATASGVIGYSDGKLKLGGSLGAALGVGLGGSVAVEVDVKQIGTMARNTAVNVEHAVHQSAVNAGRAVQHAASNVGHAVQHAASDVGHAVVNAEHAVAHAASDAGHAVANTVSNAASTVSHAASNVGHAASSAVSSAASTVRSWLPW